jgi:hypothetical protein
MKAAAAAFVGAAIFLAGVMVGLGSGDGGDQEAPVAIALVDRGDLATPSPSPVEDRSPSVKEVEHPAKQGEADDDSGPGGGEAEYWEEEGAHDSSGPGGGGGDTSGSGGGDDTSGPSGGGGDSSGPGGGDSSGSGSSGSGSDGSGGSSGPG